MELIYIEQMLDTRIKGLAALITGINKDLMKSNSEQKIIKLLKQKEEHQDKYEEYLKLFNWVKRHKESVAI